MNYQKQLENELKEVKDKINVQLSIRYQNICAEYIKLFEEKQELEFDSWIGGDGGIAHFRDVYYFSFDDIRLDIDQNNEKGLIIEYFYDSIDNLKKRMNYKSYAMGLRFDKI